MSTASSETTKTPSPNTVPIPATPAVGSEHRLTWLLYLLVLLLLIWAIPYLIEQWAYRQERGKQNAWRESFSELGDARLASINQLFSTVAKRLNPSVVHIDTQRRTVRTDELSSMFGERTQQSEGEASGVIVDAANGYIVTNYHVIAGATIITVHLSDGKHDYQATVVGSDPKNDLAVLKINARDLVPATWGDSDQLEVGELVWAMGNPFGLDNTLTMGIVSAKGRRGVNGQQRYQEYLQTDAAVNPGNSGGPLVNLAGQIVGINTAIVGPTYQGISFAIPSNIAQELYQQIIKQGRVPNGYLGVGLTIINEQLRQQNQLADVQGAVVTAVGPGSPAERAGLQRGDIIRRWNNQRVLAPDWLSYIVARTPAGTKVVVELLRAGQPLQLEVQVGERPSGLE